MNFKLLILILLPCISYAQIPEKTTVLDELRLKDSTVYLTTFYYVEVDTLFFYEDFTDRYLKVHLNALDTIFKYSDDNQVVPVSKPAKPQAVIIKTAIRDTVNSSERKNVKTDTLLPIKPFLNKLPQNEGVFFPTAFNLRKGEIILQSKFFILNQVMVGVNDFITLNVGCYPTFFEEPHTELSDDLDFHFSVPYFFGGKIMLPLQENKLNLAIQAKLVQFPNHHRALFNSTLTYGDRLENISLGFGQSNIAFFYDTDEHFWFSGIKPSKSKKGSLIFEISSFSVEGSRFFALALSGRRAYAKSFVDVGFTTLALDGLEGFGIIPFLIFNRPLGNMERYKKP